MCLDTKKYLLNLEKCQRRVSALLSASKVFGNSDFFLCHSLSKSTLISLIVIISIFPCQLTLFFFNPCPNIFKSIEKKGVNKRAKKFIRKF